MPSIQQMRWARILNVQKGHLFDEMWSESNKVRRQSTKKKVRDAS